MGLLPKRGVVTFVFDDGYTHVLDTVLPVLEDAGFKGVFAVPIDTSGMPEKTQFPISSVEVWENAVGETHELAAHGISHRDLSTLPPEELESELEIPHQRLKASTVVYPGGGYSPKVIEAAKKFYSAGRTVKFGFESLPPKNKLELKTFNATRKNFQVWKMNTRIIWAYITNSWIIETFHIFDSSQSSTFNHSISIRKFKRHLRWIARIPISNKTIRDVITATQSDT